MNDPTTTWDVIVLGLGAMGAAAAYQLARRGVRVLGLDRYGPPHDRGSSHGDTRITRLALGEGAHYLPLARRSHEIWRELEAELGVTLLQQVGGLVFSSASGRAPAHGAQDFLQTTIDVARQNGIPHEVLDARAMSERFPQFHFAGDETGCFEPGAGLVHPERCIAAQLEMAARHGAEVRTHEEVLDWRPDGGGVVVRTQHGTHCAGRLILAAGAWMSQFMPALSSTTRVYRQVLYWFEPEGPAEVFSGERMPVYIRVPDERAAMFYGFPMVDGTGLKVAGEQFEVTCAPDAMECTVSPGEVAAMHALASPHVRLGPRLIKAVACKYTVTPDYHFVIDRHPDCAQVWFASACSGHGFKHSAAVGEALAQQVVEGRSDCDLEPFKLARLAS